MTRGSTALGWVLLFAVAGIAACGGTSRRNEGESVAGTDSLGGSEDGSAGTGGSGGSDANAGVPVLAGRVESRRDSG